MRSLSSYLSILIPVCLMSGCSQWEPSSLRRIDVIFAGSSGQATRGVTVSDSLITALDILVFRQDGGGIECHSRTDEAQVKVSVTAGVPVRYYAVANAPDGVFNSITTEKMFNRALWDLSSFTECFVMTGSGEGAFSTAAAVTVMVNRLVSRVVLNKVTPKFLEYSYHGSTVVFKRVFLINVNGTCPYGGTPSVSDVWYNRLQREATGGITDDVTCTEDGRAVTGPAPIAAGNIFFCCPNPVDNGITSSGSPHWSERNTRIVIELSIDGVPNYYPITLPAMKCNHSYVIDEAVLLGPGSNSPDIPVDRSSISFSVKVNQWGTDDDRTIIY